MSKQGQPGEPTPVAPAVTGRPAWGADVPLKAIPAVLGELEYRKAALWARLMAGQPGPVPSAGTASPEGDRLLAAKQAAEIANVSPKWLYRHAKSLPFTRRLSPRVVRFSEAGLRRWLAARKA